MNLGSWFGDVGMAAGVFTHATTADPEIQPPGLAGFLGAAWALSWDLSTFLFLKIFPLCLFEKQIYKERGRGETERARFFIC